ncbi:hypothetical protein DRO54_04170 [Candidatus Bathyarchaeota archaeon]|nr:MAG: hypothetical protein DRO54_04170 [Candidatus Bathyarchaeota archaeon]
MQEGKLNGTEQLILRELARGPKTTKELENSPTIAIKYQAIYKVCNGLEKKGLIKRGSGSRDFKWILVSNPVVEDVVITQSSNGTKVSNLPVIRNYDHEQMIPKNVNEYVDPHGLMQKIRAIMYHTNGILMEGDSGIGKTMCVMRIAQEDNLPFYLIQGTPDTRVEDLIGFPMQVGENTIWVDGIIPRVLLCSQERKCILFIDEINRLETNVQSVFFPLLDDRCSVIIHERGGEIIKGNKANLAVIATANIGVGHFTNPLDRAFEDRFDVVKIDYLDPKSEATLLHKQTGIYKDLCKRMVSVANAIRSLARDEDDAIEKPLSTRCLLRWGKLAMRFKEAKVSKDPLMDAAEIVVVNRYVGTDQDKVRQQVEHLRGVSLDEEKEKKKQESFRNDEDMADLEEIIRKLDNV